MRDRLKSKIRLLFFKSLLRSPSLGSGGVMSERGGLTKLSALAAISAALFTVPAVAEPKVDVHGLILGDEGARYLKGVPTLDLQRQQGAIQVRSMGFHNNRPMFAVAFYNGGSEPANIAPEAIHVTANGIALRSFTVAELERQAKHKAWWTQFGLAMVGAIGSVAAASQTSTYSSSLYTPYGAYRLRGSYPSLYGQLQAARIQTDAAGGMAAIQYQLDMTLDAIGNKIIQRTTVDPGSTYAGLIVLDKLKHGDPPFDVRLMIDWNGERYPFAFLIQKAGQPVPEQYQSMLAVNSKPKPLMHRSVASAPNVSTSNALKSKDSDGAITLAPGVTKIPAKTRSGYCLEVWSGYVATGAANAPVITKSMPLCSTLSAN
jgi:hypothetical protein